MRVMTNPGSPYPSEFLDGEAAEVAAKNYGTGGVLIRHDDGSAEYRAIHPETGRQVYISDAKDWADHYLPVVPA